MSGKIYMIPNTLGDSKVNRVLPEYNREVINSIRFYIVENIKTARRFLIKAGIQTAIDDLHFYLLNKHSDPKDFESFLQPAERGENIGVISEAGVPGFADPGAEIAKIAHQRNIPVIPLIGPSSIILALMASGMNGQEFTFHGYLPIKSQQRIKKIKELENMSAKNGACHIFIEAPYRNNKLMEDIIKTCNSGTSFCIAADITLENEFIQTRTIKDWKGHLPNLHKRPAIFLLQA